MMNREYEGMLAEYPPSPTQLRKLASIGIRSAAQRDQLKHLKQSSRAHYVVEELDLYNDFIGENDESGQIRHRMAVRVGVREANMHSPKKWTLKCFEAYWVQQQSEVWQAQRTIYRFEWDRLRTRVAERTVRIIGDIATTPDQRDMGDLIDTFFLKGDEPDMWHVRSQFEMITADDCHELTASTTDYFGTVDALYDHALSVR